MAASRTFAPGTFERWGRALDRADSFLERRFLVALLFSESFAFVAGDDDAIAIGENGERLMQQVDVAPYRLDFALDEPTGVVRLCIELDGHDFHERTAEQAEHDRSRDRRLLAAGVLTIRFTGREVVRNPMACAREVVDTFAQLRAQRGPGLAKTSAPPRDDAAGAATELGPQLVDPEAEWQAELDAAQRVSEEARRRHGIV